MAEDLWEMEVDNGRIFFTAIPAKIASFFWRWPEPKIEAQYKTTAGLQSKLLQRLKDFDTTI